VKVKEGAFSHQMRQASKQYKRDDFRKSDNNNILPNSNHSSKAAPGMHAIMEVEDMLVTD
jgi:hypothetical protein